MDYESIKPNDMKAIKIDVEKRDVYEIEMDGHDYKEIYGVIGNNCTVFCAPVQFDNDDTLFADDEIVLRPHDIVGAFIMRGWSSPIYNNAVIVGTDYDGDRAPYRSDLDDIKSQIIFL